MTSFFNLLSTGMYAPAWEYSKRQLFPHMQSLALGFTAHFVASIRVCCFPGRLDSTCITLILSYTAHLHHALYTPRLKVKKYSKNKECMELGFYPYPPYSLHTRPRAQANKINIQ